MSLIIATAVVVALAVPEITNEPFALGAVRHGGHVSVQSVGRSGPLYPEVSRVSVLQATPLSPVAPIAALAPAKPPRVVPVAGGDIVAKWQSEIDSVVYCESRGDYSINTGNGFYGGGQWLPSTWRSIGGEGMPHQASKAEQDYRMALMFEAGRRGEWPNC